jgi:ribosomal protein S18 acetylase RimI-like enzyme
MSADCLAIRRAEVGDAGTIGTLLDRVNAEFGKKKFGKKTPGAEALSRRVKQLLAGDDIVVLVAGNGPDGVVVLRFREAIWSEALECYLAELYVTPECRGRGLGRALAEGTLDAAQVRGADYIELGTGGDDLAARSLYESLGFSNREGAEGGPLNYHYGREL